MLRTHLKHAGCVGRTNHSGQRLLVFDLLFDSLVPLHDRLDNFVS